MITNVVFSFCSCRFMNEQFPFITNMGKFTNVAFAYITNGGYYYCHFAYIPNVGFFLNLCWFMSFVYIIKEGF
jgi:hypothetical protein